MKTQHGPVGSLKDSSAAKLLFSSTSYLSQLPFAFTQRPCTPTWPSPLTRCLPQAPVASTLVSLWYY